MPDSLAHEVHVIYAQPEPDGPAPGLYIDGTRFPYFISQEIDLDYGGNSFPNVKIEVFAANLKITDDHGLTRHQATATPEQESAWAKRRAKEIVYEGLSDVIEWLARSNYEREQKELAEERAEQVWATQAYLNLAAILDAEKDPRADLVGSVIDLSPVEAFLDQAPENVRATAEAVRKENR